MDFLLGCNYWASHAGAEMWRRWDGAAVEADLAALAANGVSCLRVFPNWRDFQPVSPAYAGGGAFCEFRNGNDELPERADYLDPAMLARFHELCSAAGRHGMRLIVGLLTGWMSGRLFIPPALYGRNIYTDPMALLLGQKFVRGFVAEMKDEPAVAAWDLGNECNCMSPAGSWVEAHSWALAVADAIRAADPGRPVVSGMHSLEPEGAWRPADQGEVCDILTTHPYPYWVPHCDADPILSVRTLLHATVEGRYYEGLGGRPCLTEELGTMGPMVCSDEAAAKFLRVNLYSNWANGSKGVLWWCAHDQDTLGTAPYSWNMCERELGLLRGGRAPKPALREMAEFARFLRQAPPLPPARVDAVCILTRGQDAWGAAYMAGVLAKQADLNLAYAWCDAPLPDAPAYLLPSVSGPMVMEKSSYDRLREKVRRGASLLLSLDDGFLTGFEALTGLRVADSARREESGALPLGGRSISFRRSFARTLENRDARVLAAGKNGAPAFTAHRFGEGTVYFLDFPLETMLLGEADAFSKDRHQIYAAAFEAQIARHPFRVENPSVGVTFHGDGADGYAVLVNYSDAEQETGLAPAAGAPLWGDPARLAPCGACVLRLTGPGGP